MLALINKFLDWIKSFFWQQNLEITLLGLNNAGKTTLVNCIAYGGTTEDTIPTIGFNLRKVTKGNVNIKLWDVGGQEKFRNMWERYCRGVSAIVFVVDAADHDKIKDAKKELHDLISKESLDGIPLLVLANKNDLKKALDANQIIELLDLKLIKGREVSCYSISAKNSTNIDKVLTWLCNHKKSSEENSNNSNNNSNKNNNLI